ncbi:MAG: hypothetical protein LBS65_01110 [Desulfovibrio sp.]|jgi:hypothetical protein|nr:hypothetical protein [Desulfovibrio sp.]
MPAATNELSALIGSVKLAVPIPGTRFTASVLDPPYLPPPYSSLFDDLERSRAMLEYRSELRRIALRPLYLHAGQANLPNGEIGRFAAREPIMVPEMLGGRILTTNL